MYAGEGGEVSVLIFACVLLYKLAHPVEVLGGATYFCACSLYSGLSGVFCVAPRTLLGLARDSAPTRSEHHAFLLREAYIGRRFANVPSVFCLMCLPQNIAGADEVGVSVGKGGQH